MSPVRAKPLISVSRSAWLELTELKEIKTRLLGRPVTYAEIIDQLMEVRRRLLQEEEDYE